MHAFLAQLEYIDGRCNACRENRTSAEEMRKFGKQYPAGMNCVLPVIYEYMDVCIDSLQVKVQADLI
jgi:hypothetical protein